MNSIDFNEATPELEIEYPPEINDRKDGNELMRKESSIYTFSVFFSSIDDESAT